MILTSTVPCWEEYIKLVDEKPDKGGFRVFDVDTPGAKVKIKQ
jgi:hypothetical protein